MKYSDRSSILTVYSRECGRMSLLVPAGRGRGAARMRALLMPLGHFECVADLRPGRDVHTIGDVRPLTFPPVGDPLRSTLALFIADVLSSLLREQMADAHLFGFLRQALGVLSERGATMAQLKNFHIVFLVRLAKFLGIEPDWSTYAPGTYLDYDDGIFRKFPPAHRRFLPADESAMARVLSRLTFRNGGRLRLTRFERNMVVDRVLLYYQSHYPSAGEPQSLTVLRVVAD